MVAHPEVKLRFSNSVKRAAALAHPLELYPETTRAVEWMLAPLSLMAFVLGFWRLGADLNWTGEFAISAGLFSHWQVWMVIAVAMRLGASSLRHHAGRGGAAMP